MTVFADTSALYAVLDADADDDFHDRADEDFRHQGFEAIPA